MKIAVAVFVSLLTVVSSALAEQFLSTSDIHFDPFADPTLVTKLEAADVAQWEAILAASSVKTFSIYGHDLNEPLFRSALAEMRKQLPSPAFVLISGDFLAHDFQKTYQQYATDKSQAAYGAFVAKTIAYVAGAFRTTYPGVRIYPTLGNNDSDCGDYTATPNGPFLANFRDVWSPIVASRSFDRRFATGGYYHADVPRLRNVRIISLDTNFFSPKYSDPCGKPDPAAHPATQQLEWLDAELHLARAEGKRVWLLYHIPPGLDVYDSEEYGGACPDLKPETFWQDAYAQQFLAITAAHKATIAGSFAGHTHQDEFRLATGDFIHITPSVTPIFGNNPAFEIVDVRPDGTIAGYTAWNLPNVTLPWTREYSFDEAYGKRTYDATTLTQLAASIGTDPTIRQQYFERTASGRTSSANEALAKWQGYWCGLKTMTGSAFSACYCGAEKP